MDLAWNVMPSTTGPTVGADCRGLISADVITMTSVSELKITGHEEDNVYSGSAPQCEVKTYVMPILDWN